MIPCQGFFYANCMIEVRHTEALVAYAGCWHAEMYAKIPRTFCVYLESKPESLIDRLQGRSSLE